MVKKKYYNAKSAVIMATYSSNHKILRSFQKYIYEEENNL